MTNASVVGHAALVVVTWVGVSVCVAGVHPERVYSPGAPGHVAKAPRGVRHHNAGRLVAAPLPSHVESTGVSATARAD